MLSQNSIKEFSKKWQTTEQNVAREYIQHLFLASFYSIPENDKIAFKGGTALRIIHNSPRFSEDLDFTAIAKEPRLRQYIEKTAKDLSLGGVELAVSESKSTTGGWFAILETQIYSWPARIELNISFRTKGGALNTDTILISPAIIPSYSVIALDENKMVEEKIQALLSRKKPRDFFDIYYIIRSRLAVNVVAAYRQEILKNIGVCKDKSFTSELKNFLPRSYWNVINSLSQTLENELRRF